MLRRLNIFLTAGMLITFIIHAVTGSLQMFGANISMQKTISWICMGFVCAHGIAGLILTIKTLNARRLSGAGYFKDNALFWARRISGFAILIPLVMHLLIFDPVNQGAYRLEVFTAGRMISQILLAALIALHVLTNIKPALISFGVRDLKAFTADILLILSVVLLVCAAAFAVYFLRWTSF